MKKLTWITNGQYTRSLEGRFIIVEYSYAHLSAGLRATIDTSPFSLTDYVTGNLYSFKTFREAKAYCQNKVTTAA